LFEKCPNFVSKPGPSYRRCAKDREGGGDCAVRWIVETARNRMASITQCIASLPEKTQTKDIIVRPLGPDRAAMGRTFEDLKNHQRCP